MLMGIVREIDKLKERWKAHKERNFLAAHGCVSWREYELKHDSDVAVMARNVRNFYHGYDYVFPIEPQGLKDFGFLGVMPYHDQIKAMEEWCSQNCKGKWRNDWHRGFWDHQGNYEFNGIGGGDLIFFAFKEESDYMWFKLRW